jgi:hypothetical protein
MILMQQQQKIKFITIVKICIKEIKYFYIYKKNYNLD